jgi:bifunctional ADP-heptose synthase (sugar kinase/adenylyltransferase)
MKVVVKSDIIRDHYIGGKSTRISSGSPMPLIQVLRDQFLLGGAKNVARNLRSIGLVVAIFGPIGNYVEGTRFCNIYKLVLIRRIF